MTPFPAPLVWSCQAGLGFRQSWLPLILNPLFPTCLCLAVNPAPPQPASSPAIVSSSLVTDLEGLTLTDTSLVPTVSDPGSSCWDGGPVAGSLLPERRVRRPRKPQ